MSDKEKILRYDIIIQTIKDFYETQKNIELSIINGEIKSISQLNQTLIKIQTNERDFLKTMQAYTEIK